MRTTALFPSSLWDGTTGNRTRPEENIGPNYEDWDRISVEVQALQTHFTDKWQDLRVSVNSLKLSGTRPPEWTDYKGSQVLAFEDQAVEGNEEIVYFTVQLPHGWKIGSDIKPHVHWAGEDNTAGNVRWKLTYSWANIGSAFPTETPVTIDDANGDTDIHNIASFAAISGTGKKESSMLLCSLSRNSSHANDTFTSKDAYLLEIDFHYQVTGLGSTNEIPS